MLTILTMQKRRHLHILQRMFNWLDQCIVGEITFKNKKKGYIISFYRSPSRTPDQFDRFLEYFKALGFLSSIDLITVGFNCRNYSWFLGDLCWRFNIFLWVTTTNQNSKTSSKFGYLYLRSAHQSTSTCNGKSCPQFSM